MIVTEGSTNVSVPFYFVDDVGGTAPGEPTTGLLFSDIETGGSASYQRQGAARTDFTLVTQTAAGAHTDGGFVLVDDTEMAGVYRCDIPDAAVASGVDFVIIYLRAASANNTLTRPLKIDLTAVDLRNAADAGLTALTGHTPQTGDSFPRIGVAGAGLTNINLPDQTMNITGDLSGSVGTVTGSIGGDLGGDVQGDVVGNVDGDLGGSVTNIVDSVFTNLGIVLAKTTIATLTSQSVFTLTTASADDSAYLNATVVVRDAVTGVQKAVSRVVSYTGATKSLEVTTPSIFTMAVGDIVTILPADPRVAEAADNILLVLTDTGNLLTNVADVPTVAEFNARTILAAAYFDPSVDTVTLGASGVPVGGFVTDAITADAVAADAGAELANALLDLTDGVEPGASGTERTVREALRIILSASAGKLSGAATSTVSIRDTNDTKDRIVATVDADGNRSVVTLIDT